MQVAFELAVTASSLRAVAPQKLHSPETGGAMPLRSHRVRRIRKSDLWVEGEVLREGCTAEHGADVHNFCSVALYPTGIAALVVGLSRQAMSSKKGTAVLMRVTVSG